MYTHSLLDNGIQIITQYMPGVRSVSMGFLFDASPGRENQRQYGVAHLCEHLFFKGTIRRDATEIARVMDSTGGSMSAFTSRDYTCFSATVLDDYRTYAIDLLGDLFINSQFSEESLTHEKNSIQHELKAALDQPDICAHEALKAQVWQDHPLGRPIGGTLASVEQIKREDVLDFVQQNYCAKRLIVAAAGNLEHNDFAANIHDALWALPAGHSPMVVDTKPVFHQGLVDTKKDIQQTYFSIGLQAAPYTTEQRYEIHLLSFMLGGGISSRLFNRLRQSQGLVYEIHAEYQAYRDDGILVIEGSTIPEYTEEVISQIFDEIQGLANGTFGIDEEELWKAKMQLTGQHIISAENTQSRMSSLLTQQFYFGRPLSSQEIAASIQNVHLARLNRTAEQFFSRGLQQPALSLVGPKGAEVCSESLRHLLRRCTHDFQQNPSLRR